MEWWQPILLGAGIDVLAGPLTELVKSFFTRKHEPDKRRRTFQRDTLIALLGHMTDDEIAWGLARDERKKMGWPEEWQIDHAAEFHENAIQARRQWLLVDDKQARELSMDAIVTALGSLGATTVEESDE